MEQQIESWTLQNTFDIYLFQKIGYSEQQYLAESFILIAVLVKQKPFELLQSNFSSP